MWQTFTEKKLSNISIVFCCLATNSLQRTSTYVLAKVGEVNSPLASGHIHQGIPNPRKAWNWKEKVTYVSATYTLAFFRVITIVKVLFPTRLRIKRGWFWLLCSLWRRLQYTVVAKTSVAFFSISGFRWTWDTLMALLRLARSTSVLHINFNINIQVFIVSTVTGKTLHHVGRCFGLQLLVSCDIILC